MQTFTKPTSSKTIPNHNQTLTRLRSQRLRKSTSLLGEPDIITVTRVKTTTSFFSKEKKTEETSEYFINGIIFPTTAHFSTYISSKYQSTESKSSNLAIKAKLIMFDAFQQKDIHAQINIPGSLEVKVFNLSGQALKSQPQDYQRAYYSSYLRSLKPMNYPNIVLSPYIYKIDTHKQVLRKLIPFCFQNSLRQLHYQIRPVFTSLLQQEYNGNLALQLIMSFLVKNSFWNLVDLVVTEIEKIAQVIQLKDVEFLNHKLLLMKKDYRRVLQKSSQVLLTNPSLNQWKQMQVQSLYRVKNYKTVKILGDNIIRHGGTHPRIYQLIAMSYLQTKDFNNFLKILNSILTLYNQQQVLTEQVSHCTRRLYFMQIAFSKGENMSSYPQLCFDFDNQFLNRQNKLAQYKSFYSSNSNNSGTRDSMEEMVRLISRIDSSLQYKSYNKQSSPTENTLTNTRIFYSLLVRFQKLKGWSQVVRHRGECFWLETDFRNDQQSNQHSLLFASTSSMLQNSTTKKPSIQRSFATLADSPQKHNSFKSISDTFQINRSAEITHDVEFNPQQGQVQFQQAGLSEQQDQQEISDMPACSKRVSSNANTARRKFFNLKKTSSQDNMKVLCSLPLQRLFISFYDDLKLQIQLEKWAMKLNFSKINQLTSEKKELVAILFLKKAFLHLKLQRYRKCQQSLKCARKVSQSPLILLISSYQLIQLYMKNNTMKGVEFYIVDLVKLFNLYGIKKFDIVPEWAKDIITYIVEMQGMSILGFSNYDRKLAGPFKELLVRWLRNNHSENSLLKKDATNKSQAMYKISA